MWFASDNTTTSKHLLIAYSVPATILNALLMHPLK